MAGSRWDPVFAPPKEWNRSVRTPAPGTCRISHPLGAFLRVSRLWPFFRPNPPLGLSLQSLDPCDEQPALAGICLSYTFDHPVPSRRMGKEWPSIPEINSRRKATRRGAVVTPVPPASALLGFWPLRLSPPTPGSGCPPHPLNRLAATEPKLHRWPRQRVLRASELAGLSRVCWPLWSSVPYLSNNRPIRSCENPGLLILLIASNTSLRCL